jgi:pimeloyl-ACP methyl ester carboxylesterase
MEEKSFFESNGLKLCGILTKPAASTNKCVVLCHGMTVTKEEDGIFTELAGKLAKAGFAVFRFDFRGHGESAGNSVDMTVAGEKEDLESAIEFLQTKGYRTFGILGASFGGGVVSVFAAGHPDIAKALVLWNPLVDYHSIFEPELPWPKANFGKEAMLRLEKHGFIEVGKRRFRLGKPLFDEMKKLHPWKGLQKLKVPILFVHGDNDTYVPYEDSVKYSKLLKAELKTIRGAEHGFHDNKKVAEEADKVTIEFFLKNL